jgi:hypothetical protein
MGRYDESRRGIMDWQSTLGAIKAHGSRLAITGCSCPDAWRLLDVDVLIAELGEGGWLWDVRPVCPRCAARRHYLCAPGSGSTPFRPMTTPGGKLQALHEEVHGKAERQAFLRSFGFSKRDVLRIRAMAETATPHYTPVAMNDLDAPFRVGACIAGDERHSSGQILGLWKGRTLLWWGMNALEREAWARRPKGPRPV